LKRYLLDTSALLTLRDDEPGAAEVADLLAQAQQGLLTCHACLISRMELLYRVWRDEGEAAARLAYEQVLTLPIEWVEPSEPLLLEAAAIKARHTLSMADAWVAASASRCAAVLIHKDPEFTALALAQQPLPFKASKPRRAPKQRIAQKKGRPAGRP
jgi:predicted nucleic acid-binding protein